MQYGKLNLYSFKRLQKEFEQKAFYLSIKYYHTTWQVYKVAVIS